MRTPEELYRAFQKGDREAFAEIVATYRESVIHFLYRYVSNLDDAEDLAEDTFVAVLEHPHRFRFSCSLRSYLFAIARNKALHHLRKHRNIVPLEYEEQLASPTVSPEERLIFKEQLEQVLGLPEKYRMDPEQREFVIKVLFECNEPPSAYADLKEELNVAIEQYLFHKLEVFKEEKARGEALREQYRKEHGLPPKEESVQYFYSIDA